MEGSIWRRRMHVLSWCLIASIVGCSFPEPKEEDGSGSGGPAFDEADLVLSTAAELRQNGTFTDTFLYDLGGGLGTVEPIARVPGKLLIEIDDDGGAFDGTWASKPPRSMMQRHSLMTPSFSQAPRGAPANFNAWFFGEMRLDAGAQKVGVVTATNAIAFVDLLGPDGDPLVHCTAAECDVTAPAAGWYTVRAGWRRPATALDTTFSLRWSYLGGPIFVAADRLRTPLHTVELTGSRIDGFSLPRSFSSLENATVLDTEKPIDLAWSGSLLGLGTSSSYRSLTQLRVAESGAYDFVLDADSGTSYRFWLDGEWESSPARFDYVADVNDPPPETISRTLSAGWHDVVLEGYDTRGNNGEVKAFFGKQGQATEAPNLVLTRPAIGIAPQQDTRLNSEPIQMIAGTAVSRDIVVDGLSPGNPGALAIDVWLVLKPREWDGLTIHIVPPGSSARIPLIFDSSQLIDNQVSVVSGSLRKDRFGANDKAHGIWRVEVTHPNAGGVIDATNQVAEVKLDVHYAGSAGSVTAPPLVSSTSIYTRIISLDQERELRGLFVEAIKPAGTDVQLSAQLCSDASGSNCSSALSVREIADEKPKARYVKVTATFTSDGFAVPILTKLTLRYHKPL